MRRFAVAACAFGLLMALTASAGAAKVIDVPATAVFRSANNGPPNCSAFVFIQWPAQENAQAWELEYDYLKGTADTLTHAKLALSPPFDDALEADKRVGSPSRLPLVFPHLLLQKRARQNGRVREPGGRDAGEGHLRHRPCDRPR